MCNILLSVLLKTSTLLAMSDFDKAVERADKIFAIIGTIFAVIFVGTIVLSVVLIRKGHKTTKNIVTKVKNKIAEQQEYYRTKDICEYCGTKMTEEENSCPGCGAKRTK